MLSKPVRTRSPAKSSPEEYTQIADGIDVFDQLDADLAMQKHEEKEAQLKEPEMMKPDTS